MSANHARGTKDNVTYVKDSFHRREIAQVEAQRPKDRVFFCPRRVFLEIPFGLPRVLDVVAESLLVKGGGLGGYLERRVANDDPDWLSGFKEG